MILQKHLDLLVELGTEDIEHEKASFFEHLKGVATLLQDWGNEESVCLAGLFHSIYGTQSFQQQTLTFDKRHRVRDLIGEAGERLAFLFCTCDRRSLFTNFDALANNGDLFVFDMQNQKNKAIDRTTLVQLIEMEMANLLDQAPEPDKLPQSVYVRMTALLQYLKGLISDSGVNAMAQYLASAKAVA